jgi:hypothetical protein
MFTGTQGCLNLLRLTLEELFGRLLELELIGKVGDASGVLAHDARLTCDFALIANQSRLMLGLAQRLEVLGSARERVVGPAVRIGSLHIGGFQTAGDVPETLRSGVSWRPGVV